MRVSERAGGARAPGAAGPPEISPWGSLVRDPPPARLSLYHPRLIYSRRSRGLRACALSRLISPCLWRNQERIRRCPASGPPVGSQPPGLGLTSCCRSPPAPGSWPAWRCFREDACRKPRLHLGPRGSALPRVPKCHLPVPEWALGAPPGTAFTKWTDGASTVCDHAGAVTRVSVSLSLGPRAPAGQTSGLGAFDRGVELGPFSVPLPGHIQVAMLSPGHPLAPLAGQVDRFLLLGLDDGTEDTQAQESPGSDAPGRVSLIPSAT